MLARTNANMDPRNIHARIHTRTQMLAVVRSVVHACQTCHEFTSGCLQFKDPDGLPRLSAKLRSHVRISYTALLPVASAMFVT